MGNHKTTRATQDDKNELSQDVYVPDDAPGIDPEIFQGYRHHGMPMAKLELSKSLSKNSSMRRIKVRYKPKEITAYYVESEYSEGESKRNRKSGFLVPGPGRGIFYVPEEKFSKFFEIIEDEGKIIR